MSPCLNEPRKVDPAQRICMSTFKSTYVYGEFSERTCGGIFTLYSIHPH